MRRRRVTITGTRTGTRPGDPFRHTRPRRLLRPGSGCRLRPVHARRHPPWPSAAGSETGTGAGGSSENHSSWAARPSSRCRSPGTLPVFQTSDLDPLLSRSPDPASETHFESIPHRRPKEPWGKTGLSLRTIRCFNQKEWEKGRGKGEGLNTSQTVATVTVLGPIESPLTGGILKFRDRLLVTIRKKTFRTIRLK